MPNQTSDQLVTISIFKCPECGEYNQGMNYRVSTKGREWGTAYLEDIDNFEFDHNSDDSESGDWENDIEYQCIECNNTISPHTIKANSKILKISTSQFNEIRTDNSNHLELLYRGKIKPGQMKITSDEKPEHNADRAVFRKETKSDFFNYGAECPKCHNSFQVGTEEKFLTCVECGKEFEKIK